MEKKCFKCGEVKPIDDFYVLKKMADGHLNKCKECTKKDMKVRLLFHGEKVREDDRKRYRNNEKRRDGIFYHAKQWNKKNPEKYRAHYFLSNAIRDKRIIKPDYCEVCGKKCKPHGHHSDYSRPLEVVWMCAQCHGQIQ